MSKHAVWQAVWKAAHGGWHLGPYSGRNKALPKDRVKTQSRPSGEALEKNERGNRWEATFWHAASVCDTTHLRWSINSHLSAICPAHQCLVFTSSVLRSKESLRRFTWPQNPNICHVGVWCGPQCITFSFLLKTDLSQVFISLNHLLTQMHCFSLSLYAPS